MPSASFRLCTMGALRLPGHTTACVTPFLMSRAVRIFIFSLFSSVWCVFGLFSSAIISNKFVSFAMPLIGYYTIGNLCDYLPDFLNINRITNCSNILGNNTLLTFIYSLLFYIAIIVIFILLFYKAVQRRVNNEFN